MSKPIQPPKGAPAHICVTLVNEIDREERNETAYLDELQRKIDTGEITQGDADRNLSDSPASAKDELLGYCAQNCGAGTCALKGFGVELVGADYDTLSPADKERFDFYRTIDANRYLSEVALGINLF